LRFVSVELFRIDDRLIHGQVVVGWGQPLGVEFIVLVDDEVAASDWERDLYRMGVPAAVEVYFESLDDAVRALPDHLADERRGILLTGDVETMRQLSERTGRVERVNVGGVHHRAGRTERLRYVFLTAEEERELRALEKGGVDVFAQDVPASTPVPLTTVLMART
jgi:PTS system mannose-specific IIB component/fructoselysine and glucoselysine-specific PTS system IIB component